MAELLIRSDARAIPLADESVQCCITSPPYWGLRSYHGGENMIGLEPTFEAHLENLVAVFREVRRVLRDDGTLWLNYGDAYFGGKGASNNTIQQLAGRSTPTLNAAQHYVNEKGSTRPLDRPQAGMKPKDLMMMPASIAIALRQPHLKCNGCGHVAHEMQWGRWPNGRRICPGCELSKGAAVETPGWYVRSKIIWHKPNPMPESVTDRPTNAYEEMFLLSKSGDKLFWTHRAFPGVRVQPEPDYVFRLWKKVNGQRVLQKETPIEPPGWRDDDNWQRVNLWVGHDYFYDAEAVRQQNMTGSVARLAHANIGTSRKAPETTDHGIKAWHDRNNKSENTTGANLRNVWTIPTQSVSAAHFATYPEKLVEPCILAGTSADGACAKCGAPWARITEKELIGGSARPSPVHDAETNDQGNNRSRDGHRAGGRNQFTTIGWQPTCDCEAPKVPCTVLDPFVGSGTTLRVATRFNRQGIGLDLAYQEIAKKRTSRVQRELPLG